MEYTFRGKTVFKFYQDQYGRLEGKDGTKYTLDIGYDAFLCIFINDDIIAMKQFMTDIQAVLDGQKDIGDLKDVDVN